MIARPLQRRHQARRTSAADGRASAFWVTGPAAGAIRSVDLAPAAEDSVLVEARYSGISRGTETIVFCNRVPESQWRRMRCPFQEGDFPAPVKYGYATVGRVSKGPLSLLGQDVFVLHPHQDRFVVPAAAVIPLPPMVPPARAVLAANMETALNGLWDADIRAGDRVCVVGAGVIGLCVAWLAARIPAVTLRVIDVDAKKAAAAQALDLPFTTDPRALGAFDVIIHASGNPAGLASALDWTAFEATIVEMSWYGATPVTLPLGEHFHSRRLTIRASQVGAVAASQRTHWSSRRRLEQAVALLDDPVLDCLVSGESPFADLPTVMADIAGGRRAALCHRIVY